MSIIKWIAVFSTTFYFAVVAILYLGQRSFIYLPETRWIEPQQAGLSSFETVEIRNAPERLRSWWKSPPSPDAPVILHFHGNGGSIAGRSGMYQALSGNKYGLLAAEYPGYAGNDGDKSEENFFAAAQLHYDWLLKKGYKPEQIILAGQSLGTGVAVHVASNNKAAGLLLEAPYSSIADVAAGTVPWIPVRLLLKDHYDSQSHISSVEMPVIWVHGDQDEVINIALGQKLFDAAKAPKCKQIIKGAGHNDLWGYDIAAIFRRNIENMTKQARCSD